MDATVSQINLSPKISPRIYPCNRCSTCFSKMSNLKRHIRSTHNSNRFMYMCEECPYETERKDNLHRHIKTSHPNSSNVFSDHVRPFDPQQATVKPADQRPVEVLNKFGYKNKVKFRIIKGNNEPKSRPVGEIPVRAAHAPKYTHKWINKTKQPLSPPSPRSNNQVLYKPPTTMPNPSLSTVSVPPDTDQDELMPEDPLDIPIPPSTQQPNIVGFDANSHIVTHPAAKTKLTKDPRTRPGDRKEPKLVQVEPVTNTDPPKPSTPPRPIKSAIPSLLTLPDTPSNTGRNTIFSGNVYVINDDHQDTHKRPPVPDPNQFSSEPLPGPGEPTWSFAKVCTERDMCLLEVRDMLAWLTTQDPTHTRAYARTNDQRPPFKSKYD